MPDRRWHKMARDLWLHRARSLMTILAIVVGLASAGAVLDTWSLLRRVTREQYLATNPASATLRLVAGDTADARLLAAVRAVPGVADVQARRTVVASVLIGGSWRNAQLFVSADPSRQRIGRIVHERGAWPPSDGALVLENSSVEFAGADVGDSADLRIGEGAPIRLPVTGVARDAGLAPGWMEHVVYGFVSPATVARLGLPPGLDQLQLTVRDATLDRAGVRRVALAARDAARASGHAVREVDVPEPGEHMHAAQMDSLLLTQGAFGGLALLLSAFLVVNLVTAMLAGQVREIGIMKAIGARPSQLAAMYLGLALALGLLASLVAIPLAAVVGRAYARFAAGLLNFSIEGEAIPRAALAAQLLAGALLPVLAALVPVVRGSRIPVAAALREVGVDGGATPGWIARVHGPSRPLLLSLRNAFRRRQRMALTLVTLAAGGAMFIGALDLRASIRASVDNLFGNLMRFDFTVRLDTPTSPDGVEAIVRAIPGVAHAEAWSGARAAILGADELGGTFSIVALPARSPAVAFPVDSGRWLTGADVGALVVNRRLLQQQPTLAPGREVALLVRGRERRWRVVGVVESGPAATAYVTREALAEASGDARTATVVVRATAREVGAQSELVQRVRDAFEAAGMPVASTQLLEANRRVTEDHLLMVAGFLLVMAQLTVVVGGLGLASTMSLAVLERTREIGVLRAIGAAPRTIVRMVQAEGLTIALLSCLLAIPLSLVASVLLGRMFGRIMFPVPTSLVPGWQAVLTWLGVVVVVSLAACAWPARRATRVPTAVALAYE